MASSAEVMLLRAAAARSAASRDRDASAFTDGTGCRKQTGGRPGDAKQACLLAVARTGRDPASGHGGAESKCTADFVGEPETEAVSEYIGNSELLLPKELAYLSPAASCAALSAASAAFISSWKEPAIFFSVWYLLRGLARAGRPSCPPLPHWA